MVYKINKFSNTLTLSNATQVLTVSHKPILILLIYNIL